MRVHSNPGDTVLDFFGGSGTAGEAALRNRRQFVMRDENPEVVCVMRKRLSITGGARQRNRRSARREIQPHER